MEWVAMLTPLNHLGIYRKCAGWKGAKAPLLFFFSPSTISHQLLYVCSVYRHPPVCLAVRVEFSDEMTKRRATNAASQPASLFVLGKRSCKKAPSFVGSLGKRIFIILTYIEVSMSTQAKAHQQCVASSFHKVQACVCTIKKTAKDETNSISCMYVRLLVVQYATREVSVLPLELLQDWMSA